MHNSVFHPPPFHSSHTYTHTHTNAHTHMYIQDCRQVFPGSIRHHQKAALSSIALFTRYESHECHDLFSFFCSVCLTIFVSFFFFGRGGWRGWERKNEKGGMRCIGEEGRGEGRRLV